MVSPVFFCNKIPLYRMGEMKFMGRFATSVTTGPDNFSFVIYQGQKQSDPELAMFELVTLS